MQRWALIHDGADYDYLCPVERVDEAHAMLDALQRFWDWDARNGAEPPPTPDFLVKVEGERLTFAAPALDGAMVGGGE